MIILKWLRKRLFLKIVKKVLFHLDDASNVCKNILDIGCGSNNFFSQHAGLSVYGLDIDYEAVKGSINRKILLGNANRLPFSDNSFDSAIAILFFHSIPLSDQKTVLAEIKRVVKSGGKMIILDFCLPESITGKVIRRLLDLEEMCCGQKHHQNYTAFIKRGGLEGLLRLSGLDYEVIDKYRFGNLVLIDVELK
jgi:ubiquinone/menaquinone biosynthesis C-methylase UbiE